MVVGRRPSGKSRFTLVKADRTSCALELNNPTDKDMKVTVRPSSGFEFSGSWELEVELLAGASGALKVARL